MNQKYLQSAQGNHCKFGNYFMKEKEEQIIWTFLIKALASLSLFLLKQQN